MNKITKLIAAGLAAVSLACSAIAGGSLQYFQAIPLITNGVTVTGWPTNSFGTNTGGPVAIFNQEDSIDVVAQGWLTNSSAGNLYIWFTAASTTGNNPFAGTNSGSSGANQTGMFYTDWSSNFYLLTIPLPVSGGSFATGGGWYHYETNIQLNGLPSYFLGTNYTAPTFPNADFIGIYCISNTLASSGSWNAFNSNNGIIGINKKLYPTPLIGQ